MEDKILMLNCEPRTNCHFELRSKSERRTYCELLRTDCEPGPHLV